MKNEPKGKRQAAAKRFIERMEKLSKDPIHQEEIRKSNIEIAKIIDDLDRRNIESNALYLEPAASVGEV